MRERAVSRERRSSRAAGLSADSNPDVGPDPMGLWSDPEVVIEAPKVEPDAIDDLSLDDPAQKQKEDKAPISIHVSHTAALSTYRLSSPHYHPHRPPPPKSHPRSRNPSYTLHPISRGACTPLALVERTKTSGSSVTRCPHLGPYTNDPSIRSSADSPRHADYSSRCECNGNERCICKSHEDRTLEGLRVRLAEDKKRDSCWIVEDVAGSGAAVCARAASITGTVLAEMAGLRHSR
jgi:hypothetical protein